MQLPERSERSTEDPRSGLSTPSDSGSPRRKKNEAGGFEKRIKSTILLNIYDVVEHPFQYELAKNVVGLGIHHTGIQVGRREIAFTLEGIVVTEPHRIPRCKLTHRILITREATHTQVHEALHELQKTFTPHSYDPLHRNCNHFSTEFCKLLGYESVPSWVNRAPSIAGLLGTRFRLKPARITAPALAWNVMLGEDDEAKEELALQSEDEHNEHIFLQEHCSRIAQIPPHHITSDGKLQRFSDVDPEESLLDDEIFEDDDEPGLSTQEEHLETRKTHQGNTGNSDASSYLNSEKIRQQYSSPSSTGRASSTTDETPIFPVTPQSKINIPSTEKLPFDPDTTPVSSCWCHTLQDIHDHTPISLSRDLHREDEGSIVQSPYSVHKFMNEKEVISASRITAFNE